MSTNTVEVSNLSLAAKESDISEFFSFSGDIVSIEMKSDNERSQIAYVTFQDPQGAETAILLSGATIVDMPVNIVLVPDYKPSLTEHSPSSPANDDKPSGAAETAIRKAEDVVSSMLAKGFILGKDAISRAKSFDEKHQLSSTASAKVSSIDKKIGLSDKISAGTSLMSDKVREMDQKFQVSEKTKSAFATAEQKVSSAGSAIMKNRYIFTGASWVAGAVSKFTKTAGEVGQKTAEKVTQAEEGKSSPVASTEPAKPPSGSDGLIL